MEKLFLWIPVFMVLFALNAAAQEGLETDTIKTSAGDLKITFLGHATLMFTFGGKVIHVDPVSKEADYTKLPKADLVLITHQHGDHLDLKALDMIRTEKTLVVLTEACAQQLKGGTVMKNGEVKTIGGLKITFGDKRVYVAGDTENTPEVKKLQKIDVAFLPMNLPYTMTPEMAADAAKGFKPKILYPYHYGDTDVSKLVELLKDTKEVEVRIRKMK